MLQRRMFLALVVCLCTMAVPAFAGGSGGAKKDSTIKVVNNTNAPIYAFVDVSNADLASIQAAPTAAAAQTLAEKFGKLVGGGGNSALFSVKAGPHQVSAATATFPGVVIANQVGVVTVKGQTFTFTLP